MLNPVPDLNSAEESQRTPTKSMIFKSVILACKLANEGKEEAENLPFVGDDLEHAFSGGVETNHQFDPVAGTLTMNGTSKTSTSNATCNEVKVEKGKADWVEAKRRFGDTF